MIEHRTVSGETKYLLPREAYVSQAWFEREQRELFARSWGFAGMVDDLEAPGDYLTVNVGTFQLFVVRDQSGELRAFHNICRHRGAQLLEGRGKLPRGVVCPYHSWSYDLDGTLRGIPREECMFPGIDKMQLGLQPAAVGARAGLIFVNPDAAPAERFEQWWGSLPSPPWSRDDGVSERVERHTGMRCYQMRANWKLYNENALDLDHQTHLHSRTLGGPAADEQLWEIVGRHYVCSRRVKEETWPGQGSPADPQTRSGADDTALPCIWLFFPSTWVVVSPQTFTTYQVVPMGVDETRVNMRTWVRRDVPEDFSVGMYPMPGAAPDTGSPQMPLTIRSIDCHPLQSGNFELEDSWIVEGLQRSMRSPAIRVGPLSPVGDAPITFFHKNVLDFVPLS